MSERVSENYAIHVCWKAHPLDLKKNISFGRAYVNHCEISYECFGLMHTRVYLNLHLHVIYHLGATPSLHTWWMMKSHLFLHSWFEFRADQCPILCLAAKFTRLEENVILFSHFFSLVVFILTVLKLLFRLQQPLRTEEDLHCECFDTVLGDIT